jgi:hypothetical protein
MSRPFTDITKSISSNNIKNGSAITTTLRTGSNTVYNNFVKNTPTLETIQSKYGDRFYNGIFVQLVGDQTVIGG